MKGSPHTATAVCCCDEKSPAQGRVVVVVVAPFGLSCRLKTRACSACVPPALSLQSRSTNEPFADRNSTTAATAAVSIEAESGKNIMVRELLLPIDS